MAGLRAHHSRAMPPCFNDRFTFSESHIHVFGPNLSVFRDVVGCTPAYQSKFDALAVF